MFIKTSEKITNYLIQSDIIKYDDREIYRYGVQQGLTGVLNFVTTLFIGILFRMTWESIVFTVAYIPLRHYAGGFHAKTPIRCYFFSIAIITAALLAMRYIPWTNLICGITLLLSMICIILFSPVETSNKPLDDIEKNVYRKRSYYVAVTEISIIFSAFIMKFSRLMVCLIVMFLVMSVMLVLGKVKSKITPKYIS